MNKEQIKQNESVAANSPETEKTPIKSEELIRKIGRICLEIDMPGRVESFEEIITAFESLATRTKTAEINAKNATERALLSEKMAKIAYEIAESAKLEANENIENSYVDQLTSAKTRKYYDKILPEIFDPEQSHHKICSIIIDVDGLKGLNDKYGHPEGDKLIKKTAELLISHFRNSDTVIRWGGDEFNIICVDTENNENFVSDLHEKLDNLIESEPSLHINDNNDSKKVDIIFSYGIALYDKDTDENTFSNTIKRADNEMYTNKNLKKAQARTLRLRGMSSNIFETIKRKFIKRKN